MPIFNLLFYINFVYGTGDKTGQRTPFGHSRTAHFTPKWTENYIVHFGHNELCFVPVSSDFWGDDMDKNDKYTLSFAQIIRLNDHIAEVVVNEGVEMDMGILEEYHHWIAQHMSAPTLLLINKINSYTYTFEAQRNLAALAQIKAIAVVAYTRSTELATSFVFDMIDNKDDWTLKSFDNRKAALGWLEYCLQEWCVES